METEHIQKQLDFFVRDKSHHAYRKPAEDPHALAGIQASMSATVWLPTRTASSR